MLTSSQRQCNTWFPDRCRYASFQCASDTYESIKDVITQWAKWDRVIARVEEDGTRGLPLWLHRRRRSSNIPTRDSRCLTRGEDWRQ